MEEPIHNADVPSFFPKESELMTIEAVGMTRRMLQQSLTTGKMYRSMPDGGMGVCCGA
jgi:hypothetical protein